MSRTEEELRWIVTYADALPVAIWVGRVPSGECVYVNQEFQKILGITPPEDASRGNYVGPYSVHTLTGEIYPEDRMPYERALAARAPVEVDDIVIHRHDGGKVYLRVYVRPLFDDAGEITHIVEAFTDITREVLAERARAEGERQLRLVQRMESLGSLAGGIAHDFNNLLAVARLIAAQLRAREADPVKLEALRQLDEVTDSAVRLTRGLLGFARRGTYYLQRVDLNELIGSLAELARRTIDRRIELETDLQASPGVVVADLSQVEQIVMNLVLNARDAIPGAGRIALRTRELDGNVVFEVSDTGEGIDPAIRDRVFEPYVTTKTAGALKGTGLGLATVYGIVQSHAGQIEIVDTGPQGTTMRVTLPAAPPAPEAPAPPPPPPPTITHGEGTVLIVEDEPLVRSTTADTLAGLGYTVITAEDGVVALEIFRERHAEIDAVLLDMIMPRMGGRETCAGLHAIDPDVAVVLTTGFAVDEEAQATLDLGVRDVLPKPYDVPALSATLARAIASRARRVPEPRSTS